MFFRANKVSATASFSEAFAIVLVINCYGSKDFCGKLKEYINVYQEVRFTFTYQYENVKHKWWIAHL